MRDKEDIRKWMEEEIGFYIDECGDVDITLMVNDWDLECNTKEGILTQDHPAWEIAHNIAKEFIGR